jgi:hypothetical protein
LVATCTVVCLVAAAPLQARALAQARATAALNMDCTLLVPDQPLSAAGLATPFQLSATNPRVGACHEANLAQAAFVQGAVIDPASGAISIYNPLVTDRGVAPAVAPTPPMVPAGAVVALWFGFNGDVLRLRGARFSTLGAANCVNGLPWSPFGQFASCNAQQFFQRANQLIQAGRLAVPALGTGRDGKTCPTVRDFAVVDHDQSDNVTTSYLITPDGRSAPPTAGNQASVGGARTITNASDNRLLAVALDSALGCAPWMAPDLANGGTPATALPLDELQAARFQAAPVATVPAGDPMAQVSGRPSLAKQNLYRLGVDQVPVATTRQAQAEMQTYCTNLVRLTPARLMLDRALTESEPSPDPAAANSLFTFLAQRYVHTFGAKGLNCSGLLGRASPIALRTNAQGIVIGASLSGARN